MGTVLVTAEKQLRAYQVNRNGSPQFRKRVGHVGIGKTYPEELREFRAEPGELSGSKFPPESPRTTTTGGTSWHQDEHLDGDP